MARELVWRGFPTDLRGSCFPRFWPGVPGIAPPADVTPLDGWAAGTRRQRTRRHRRRQSHRRRRQGRPAPPLPVDDRDRRARHLSTDAGGTTFVNDGPVASEVFRGFLDPDITYVALDVDDRHAPRSSTPTHRVRLLVPVAAPAARRAALRPRRVGSGAGEPAERARTTPTTGRGQGSARRRRPRRTSHPASVFAADNSAQGREGPLPAPVPAAAPRPRLPPGGG